MRARGYVTGVTIAAASPVPWTAGGGATAGARRYLKTRKM
jgi:hypothetical protein